MIQSRRSLLLRGGAADQDDLDRKGFEEEIFFAVNFDQADECRRGLRY